MNMDDGLGKRGYWRKCRDVFCGRWFVAVAITLMLIISFFFSMQRMEIALFWEWLNNGESGSATLRNIGLLILATIALPFAIWRSIVAGRQVSIAQRGLRNERYQKAVEMLGDGILTVRLGGVYALQSLAKEDPVQYHIQVMRIFCSFLRWPAQVSNTDEVNKENADHTSNSRILGEDIVRADVEQVFRAIGTRIKKEVELEVKSDSLLAIYDANLRRLDIRDKTGFPVDAGSIKSIESASKSGSRQANLSHVHFQRVEFSDADLERVNMSNAVFWDTKFNSAHCADVDLSNTTWWGGTLQGAKLYSANLSNAEMNETDLSDADFSNANLSGMTFRDVNLSGALLRDADLSGTSFSMALWNNALFTRAGLDLIAGEIEEYQVGVTNITQAQIDGARADPSNPPLLEGVVDRVTGKPLVWKGKST